MNSSNLKSTIKELLDVDITTDDLASLKASPNTYTNCEDDALKLIKFFDFLETTNEALKKTE